jgi:hypothetical protein
LDRWKPLDTLSDREKRLLKLAKSRKLFEFLRLKRSTLFSDEFQQELESMYRDNGQGEVPHFPAALAMTVLIQSYLQVSDAEAIRLSATDACWRVVLGTLEEEEPICSLSTFQDFRARLIRHEKDLALIKRTVDLAKESGLFDPKKLEKGLRVAVDSRPFEGAGRVEDTFNLLGHAASKIVKIIARKWQMGVDDVCAQARTPLFAGSSIKASLDVDWNDSEQKSDALRRLCTEVDRLMKWVDTAIEGMLVLPLIPYIEALKQVKAQDVETGPEGQLQLRQGVAEDRRISIEDPEMRHGRKSKSKRFNGFKQFVETDLDTELTLSCAVQPANRPEDEATPQLQLDLKVTTGVEVVEAHVDRAFINSTLAVEQRATGGEVICKPWSSRNNAGDFFKKTDFKLDMRSNTITCPAGEVEHFEAGDVVNFDPEACGACALRSKCTKAASGRGRSISIGEDEGLQKKLRKLQTTSKGRERLRERVEVEHELAHLSNRQGPKARYRGVRKNLFDLRRLSAVRNLEVIARFEAEQAAAAKAQNGSLRAA